MRSLLNHVLLDASEDILDAVSTSYNAMGDSLTIFENIDQHYSENADINVNNQLSKNIIDFSSHIAMNEGVPHNDNIQKLTSSLASYLTSTKQKCLLENDNERSTRIMAFQHILKEAKETIFNTEEKKDSAKNYFQISLLLNDLKYIHDENIYSQFSELEAMFRKVLGASETNILFNQENLKQNLQGLEDTLEKLASNFIESTENQLQQVIIQFFPGSIV